MRPRLTASFVVLSVVLLLGALWIRAYTSNNLLRTHEGRELRSDATTLSLLIEQREELGQPVDRSFLQGQVEASEQLEYDPGVGDPVVVAGKAYDDVDESMETTVDAAAGSLTLRTSGGVVEELDDSRRGSIGFLILFVALLAAMVGYVMAMVLSAPFRQLAGAAGQLGRGRFDLDLPRTKIPEAKAISQALLTSAGQLQERLASEQAFAEHASHVLRTPLTGLRLELEDLTQRDDVPPDVRDSAARSIGRIDSMDAVAGDLVALARRGALVAGAEIPLRDLATQCAQTWADALGEQDRTLTAAIEGNLEATYTPGPVEHVLDLLLSDMLKRGQGAVRMVFEADEDAHLSIDLSCARHPAGHRQARRPPDHPGPGRRHRPRWPVQRRDPRARRDPAAAALGPLGLHVDPHVVPAVVGELEGGAHSRPLELPGLGAHRAVVAVERDWPRRGPDHLGDRGVVGVAVVLAVGRDQPPVTVDEVQHLRGDVGVAAVVRELDQVQARPFLVHLLRVAPQSVGEDAGVGVGPQQETLVVVLEDEGDARPVGL